jgi:hypothetical protein
MQNYDALHPLAVPSKILMLTGLLLPLVLGYMGGPWYVWIPIGSLLCVLSWLAIRIHTFTRPDSKPVATLVAIFIAMLIPTGLTYMVGLVVAIFI